MLLHLPLMSSFFFVRDGKEGGRRSELRERERERERERGESCHLTDCWCSVTQSAAPLTYKDTGLFPHRSAICNQANHQPPPNPHSEPIDAK